MRFIGDVHGKYKQYKSVLDLGVPTIQVGDLGVGFRKFMGFGDDDPWYANPPYDKMVEGGHRFIRGNHDNPSVCRNHTQWIPDGTREGDTLFVGGAVSVDKELRMEGYTYWPDEELSYQELDEIYDQYAQDPPRVVVSHECPDYVANAMGHRLYKFEHPSRTRQMFQSILEMQPLPEVWVFGHWHTSFDQDIKGCRFVCLNELEWKDIE